jgi:DNA adenine methylase
VLFAKPPSQCEVYNDVYSDLVTFYKVLKDPYQYELLSRIIECTPYSREVYYDSRRALDSKTISDVERARAFFVCMRQSFSNLMNSWSTPSECSRTVASLTYWKAIDRLPEVHERLKNVHIENLDAIECIKKYANERSLCYVDPPYISGTRVAKPTSTSTPMNSISSWLKHYLKCRDIRFCQPTSRRFTNRSSMQVGNC